MARKRNPVTGQFVAEDGNMNLTYSDHDIHHISHEVTYLSTADSGPNDDYADVQRFEITERGLDPDELAELRAIRVDAAMTFEAAGAQDSIGSVRASVECGYNLSGTEFLLSGRDSELVDTDGSGTDDFDVLTGSTDEVGQLFHGRLSCIIPYDDDSNGNGAGGHLQRLDETISYPQMTGTGPVVDSADDFVSRIRMNIENSITTVGCNVNYSLFYLVEETESGRTRFGR